MIWCNNFIFTTCHFTKFNFLSLNINIVALCCFIISIGRIKNGNTLYRYLVINCMESNYLKQKDLFKVANIGNWLILNYHYINFGTLSTPWKDITWVGSMYFSLFLYTGNWSFVCILKKVRTKTVYKAYVIYYNRIWLSNTLNSCKTCCQVELVTWYSIDMCFYH